MTVGKEGRQRERKGVIRKGRESLGKEERQRERKKDSGKGRKRKRAVRQVSKKASTVNLHSSGFEGTSHLYSLLPKFVGATHVTGAKTKLIQDH